MAQHDMNLADAAGAAFRSDANDALAALVRLSDGGSEPGTKFPFMWWVDTTNNLIKQRNANNDGWIVRGSTAIHGWVAVSDNKTLALGDLGTTQAVDASVAARTITLPAAAAAGNGWFVTVKKTNSDSNTVTIDGNGSETIDGSTTLVLSGQYDTVTLLCNGTGWTVISFAPGGLALGGKMLQSVLHTTSAEFLTTDSIPLDNTKPRNDEGIEVLAPAAFTPLLASSKVRVTVTAQLSGSTSMHGVVALFKDADVEASQSVWETISGANNGQNVTLVYEEAAVNTDARSFKARAGSNGATCYVNRANLSFFGGTLISSMLIEEIAA